MRSSEVREAAAKATGGAKEILAKAAVRLDLEERIRSCTSCALHAGVTAPVPMEGSGPVAIIGEAPGANEDHEGRPFVGRAGKLLNESLSRAGFKRSDVALINVICCRPPQNDFTEAVKADAPTLCKPNFLEQLAASGAWLLVPVGNRALSHVLPVVSGGITANRGKHWWEGTHLVMPTFHPAYALRSSNAKLDLITDLLAVKRVLQGVNAAPVPKDYDPTKLIRELAGELTHDDAAIFRKHFKKHGWVRAWSPWLEDQVVLVRDEDVDYNHKLAGVRYTVQELAQISRLDRTWGDALRLHYAKKTLDAHLI